MNEDIKTELDAELPHGRVPFALDTDKAVDLGRRTRKRRKLLATGGSVLSAVAVTGLVVTLLTPGQPSDDQAADDKTNNQDGDFPELNPKFHYQWAGGAYQNNKPPKPIDDYTAAFWKHLDSEYPDAKLSWFGGDSGNHAEGEDAVYFHREEQMLIGLEDPTDPESMPDKSIHYDRDTYSMLQWDDTPESGGASDPTFAFTEDRGTDDTLTILVFPAGTYKKDSGDVYDPAGCNNDDSFTQFESCDAEKAEGPDGQDLRQVSMKTEDDGQPPVEAERSVVYYRADGSAVVVSDEVSRTKESDPAPYLSYEQLAEFAFALPDTPVE
ncbi:hypothetical protein [Stackebrandtia nassauensis]|uniref:Uncharacterized protein n=1 Tax=Stackebrandtia nassauensis (strain DSM 44728 / CIP 108903 / NRRL B-16338 / NBRC 102104 / LLR-40K-21) TaxID=446470 RepID=D3QAD4_STANL|nr:hypothetical protein [Stackebrandtia nassauensis]ADD42717.1 hypothetical protein Snas_3046 [Stackebrandtia nassauensis DSM 44728]